MATPAGPTPLRQFAFGFAAAAGYPDALIKVRECKAAVSRKIRAYDVLVKQPGDKRGKCIGAIVASRALTLAEADFFGAHMVPVFASDLGSPV